MRLTLAPLSNETHGLSHQRSARLVPVLVPLLLALSAGVGNAHVALDEPNGGTVHEVGSILTIRWHDVVDHGPADYDLWYSTTGPDGPWITIAFDLEPPEGAEGYTHDWTIPDTPSSSVRVRVQQDNVADSPYLDISDSDLSIVRAAQTQTVVIEPTHDATLYESDSQLANGSGSYLFTGRAESRNAGLERRALLEFDIEGSIPQGSTITEVGLRLNVSRTISGAQEVEIRKVLESWSEGSSTPAGQEGGGAPAGTGDTTWTHRMHPETQWASPGGTFESTASGTQQLGENGPYTFASTSGLVADVQGWLDNPSSNHGWALVMPDAPVGSAKRLDSRENPSSASRPRLTITYETALQLPIASFTLDPQRPRVGDAVHLVDTSTGPPTSRLWDLGDGSTSTQESLIHAYATAGTNTITLTVSNDAGSDSATATITVDPADGTVLDEIVVVPGVANAEGSEGSFFITTLDIHNAGSALARYRLLWLPSDTNNSSPTESPIFTLGPGQTQRFANVLLEVFQATDAVGALALASDSPDLMAMSRTFNPTDLGTLGQGIPGVSSRDMIPAGRRVRLLFLSQNNDSRSNIGLVNTSALPITVQWELFSSNGTSLRTGETFLPAWGNKQLNRVLAAFAPIEAVYADVWTQTTGGTFTCYGSVLDNISSDPTTVLPR